MIAQVSTMTVVHVHTIKTALVHTVAVVHEHKLNIARSELSSHTSGSSHQRL